ncbi:MAG: DUF4364 family protein [Clostridia bacterium]|jgi:hypothetical protein|nr:DUF4364 family protein [Clostridia bacterium]MBQ5661565.1 DUF4364 family protein [Clostridia bacterium]MBR7152044.1 DUF4364 family protein [Clostridia bacterium]
MPSSSIGSKNTVKIFVLYLMRNINYPMDFVTINDIVMQNDYVMYLDFAESFHEMLDQDLIMQDGVSELGDPLYSVTRKGALVAEQLRSDIRASVLDKSLTCALRYLDFKKRNITLDCSWQHLADATYDVTFWIREEGKETLSVKINVDSEYRCQQIRRNFRERPEVMYRGIMALLCGKVDYLFDR